MESKRMVVEQECSSCGRRFKLEYKEKEYVYLEDPCECAADFFAVNGPSFSEYLEEKEAESK